MFARHYVGVISYGKHVEVLTGRYLSRALARRAFAAQLERHPSQPRRFLYGPVPSKTPALLRSLLEQRYRAYDPLENRWRHDESRPGSEADAPPIAEP